MPPYNQGYQAPPRQMNPSGGMGARPSMFQQPQQQQKQGGGFWKGLGNAIKAPFTSGSTTNNYYGGGQQMQGNRYGQMQGGFGRAFGGGMNRGMNQGGQMNPGMQKPPMGQGQPQWNPTNMFTPGNSSEYINRANVNPWMGNAPGMQPGGGSNGVPGGGYSPFGKLGGPNNPIPPGAPTPEQGVQQGMDMWNQMRQGGGAQPMVEPRQGTPAWYNKYGSAGPNGMPGPQDQGGIGPSQDMMQGQMGQYDPNYRSPMQGGGYQDPRFQSMM